MWKFERLISSEFTSPTTSIVHDGRDVWVGTEAGKIEIFTYWDVRTHYEGIHGGYYPNITIPEVPELPKIDEIDLGHPVNEMVKVYDHIYTWHDCQLIKINIDSKQVERIKMPEGTLVGSLLGANNKVWYVTRSLTNNKDSLAFFDTISLAFSTPVTIPGRVQIEPRKLVWAYDQFIIVNAFNDNGVHKFDSTTGLFVSTTYINRKPRALTANQSREVLVASKNGMISKYDQVADTYQNLYATLEEADSIVDDGRYIWGTCPYLTRTDKTALVDNFRLQSKNATHPSGGTFTGIESYALQSFGSDNFKDSIITPEFTYQHWNGSAFETRTVKQYVFLLAQNKVYAFRNASLYRDNFIQVRMTGMVATGETGYYGETI